MTYKNSKALQSAAVLLLAATVVFAGTFAWGSFNKSKINVFTDLQQPNVNLHDDFEKGPNKDVYVENSGNTPSYLRVRLTEYLQTEFRGSLVEGHLYEEQKSRDWAPHNGMKSTTEGGETNDCTLLPPNTNSAAWSSDTFHDYYTWQMGGSEFNPTGQIYYLPATNEQRGGYEADGITVREPQVVSNPLTGSSPKGDVHLAYAEQVKELVTADTGMAGETGETDYPDIDPADPDADKLLAAAKEGKAMETLGIKKTLTADVITMEQWKTGNKLAIDDPAHRAPYTMGDYWVVDADGWCYWAGPLAGGEATGLLLDAVNRTQKNYDSNAEYAINVWLQAVDGSNTGRFETPDAGGMTDDGKKLIALVTGKIVTDTDGNEYLNNNDGTYTPAAPDGTPAPGKPPFVPLGKEDVNTPVENRLEIGRRVTVDTLVWDGSDYRNWATESAKAAPWYNITKATVTDSNTVDGKVIYEVTGTRTGLDGVTYLELSTLAIKDGTANEYIPDGNILNVAAITRTDTRAVGGYTQTNPGSGPVAFIWAGDDGKLGDSDDTRLDPSVELITRYFSHLGNGIYIETADEGDTVSKDTPVKYFFAGKAVAGMVENHLTVTSISEFMEEKITAQFPLQLAAGDKFNITEAVASGQTNVTGYTPTTGGKYTLTEVVQGGDGKLYINLGTAKPGYLAMGSDEYLGNDGDLHVWVGADGTIGTSDDVTLEPPDFSEPFLKDKTLADMKPGGKFTVDGMEWVVLGIDSNGYRMVATTSAPSKIIFGQSNVYSSSNLRIQCQEYQKIAKTLFEYAMPVDLAPLAVTVYSATGAKEIFALSLLDAVLTYSDILEANWRTSDGLWYTRSLDSRPGQTAVYLNDSSTVSPSINKHSYRPAMLVKFSDVK